jgi:hypothetical protein
MSDDIRNLLSEGLDLCVRARDMAERDRRRAALDASSHPDEWQASGRFDDYVKRNNIENPNYQIHTRSATIPLWLEEQYQTDLADWERRARAALMKEPNPPPP